MEKSLFRYIWLHSKRDQLIICAVVLASLPFYFMSLDLPRRIVNQAILGEAFEDGRSVTRFLALSFTWPDWLGGGVVEVFEGFPVGRLGLLFGLSALFLFFVVVNGAFKYWINVAKGALGERMLRRMRFELFSLMLRFSPEALRTVKASETATIIKDEVEPVGGFIGDAFIQPALLSTQAATALLFILLQNVWLGLIAVAIIGVQIAVIPRLRRQLLRLGKQRQLASRRLAGRVAEVLDGVEAVHAHNAHAWERAEIGHRLYELFDIRFRIYKRKFMVKFLNNFLAQLTPFLFYAVGGYFALTGRLDIGQLVAVIAAYRELPPPLKELIDWDQQRLDVQVKYDQVVQHFAPERLMPLDEREAPAEDMPLVGPLAIDDLTILDSHGVPLLEDASLRISLPARVALMAEGGSAAGVLARILARRTIGYSGRIAIGERELSSLSPLVVGRRIAYAGIDPVLFPGTVRANLVYGLRQRPVAKAREHGREVERRLAEALRTGNSVDSIADSWVDFSLAGVGDQDELDHGLVQLLRSVGLGPDIYRFGLSGAVDPDRNPDLAERLVEARARLREVFLSGGMNDLVEPFDPERYNGQATVAENLLFGVPTTRELMGRALAEHPALQEALQEIGLKDDLIGMGAQIAETMSEIFRGLPPGHPLFEQFSFAGADELGEYEAILRRRSAQRQMSRDEATRLLALPLAYIEPRHRLGLLDEELKVRLVEARTRLRQKLERSGRAGVEFYDPERVCASAPLKDNLLFGRISHVVANAQPRVAEAIAAVVDDLGLREAIERIGLDHQVGPAGRLLTAQQRSAVNLVRCLVKRPDILVVDGALAPLGEGRAAEVRQFLLEALAGRSLFFVAANEREAQGFDKLVHVRDGRLLVKPGHEEPMVDKKVAGGVA